MVFEMYLLKEETELLKVVHSDREVYTQWSIVTVREELREVSAFLRETKRKKTNVYWEWTANRLWSGLMRVD